jgi:hypothetical protein
MNRGAIPRDLAAGRFIYALQIYSRSFPVRRAEKSLVILLFRVIGR